MPNQDLKLNRFKREASVCCLALLLIGAGRGFSQSIISLPNYSPLTLNPALSGESGFYKLNFDSKSQWKSVGSPFKTTQASFDISLRKAETAAGGHFGFGILMGSDAGGTSNFAEKQVLLSSAYHLKITGQSNISLGFNTGLVQHQLSNGDGRWGSQYTGFEYDPTLSSGEQIPSDSYADWSLGAGVHYAWEQGKPKRGFSAVRRLNAGLSAAHLTSAELGSSGGLRTALFPSYRAYLRGGWPIAEQLTLEPAYYFRSQSAYTQHYFGCDVRFIINDGQAFSSKAKPFSMAGGVFLRLQESIAINGSVRWSDYSLSLAYDIATGDLAEYANGRSGFELGFGWWVDARKQK